MSFLVSLKSLQTQVLHRLVNGFVRWPFHRASHEDRQQTAISLCVVVCARLSLGHQESLKEIKEHTGICSSRALLLRVAGHRAAVPASRRLADVKNSPTNIFYQ